MKEITILIPASTSDVEAMSVKIALQEMAKNVSVHHVKWLGELSKKKGINQKLDDLRSNPLAKMYL